MIDASRLPSRIFVDSGALFPIFNPRDAHHAEAQLILKNALSVRNTLVTSNFVIAETHALMLARVGRERAFRFLRGLERSATVIERVTEEDEQRAIGILTRYDDKDFTYTDATSFAVMERLRMDTAFAFDRHFNQYGFRTLTADQSST